MTARRLLTWLLVVAAAAWLALMLTVPPPGESPACLAGLDTLESLAVTPSVSLLDEVEAACGR
jgi:hypothetical protein